MQLTSPQFSFVRFGEQDNYDGCTPANPLFCLPVFAEDDIYFQFILNTDTKAEADALCSPQKVTVGLTSDCNTFDLDFSVSNLYPEVIRTGETQVVFNWLHGFPGFDAVYAIRDCFKILVEIEDTVNAQIISGCSNCFERIADDCYTSVIEYGSAQNIFDFNYCGTGVIGEDPGGGAVTECADPAIIIFTNATTLNIPYTPQMASIYGVIPTVEVYIWDGAKYNKDTVQQGFDANPPTAILIDLGGSATGFVKIS